MQNKMFKVWKIIPGYLSCWNQPLLDSQSAPGKLFSGPTTIKLAFSISKNGYATPLDPKLFGAI